MQEEREGGMDGSRVGVPERRKERGKTGRQERKQPGRKEGRKDV